MVISKNKWDVALLLFVSIFICAAIWQQCYKMFQIKNELKKEGVV